MGGGREGKRGEEKGRCAHTHTERRSGGGMTRTKKGRETEKDREERKESSACQFSAVPGILAEE